MALSRRWTAAAIVGVAGIAGAFLIVPEPPEVVTVSPEPGEAAYTSIQEAVDSLGERGGAVEVREGRYQERVVLDHLRGVSLRARTGDEVVLDASGLTPPPGRSGVVEVRGGSLIEVIGLELTGYRSSSGDAVPVGLLGTGDVDGLRVEDVQVHGIGTTVEDPITEQSSAHGIAVVGDAVGSTTDVLVSRVEVWDLDLGTGAGITVTGNVVGWEVTESHVHGVDHHGIEASGWDPVVPEERRLAVSNRARSGVISSTVVEDVTGRTNPAYGPEGCLCAAGIAVDGAFELVVRDNTVEHTDIGVLVVAEDQDRDTEGVDVVDNELREPRAAGVLVGAVEADATTGTGHGTVTRVLVRGNRLLEAEGGGAQALVRLGRDLRDVRVSSNDLTLQGPDGVLVHSDARGPVLDLNRYVADEPRFALGQRVLTDLRAWQLLTRQDTSSTVRSP